MEIGDLPGKVFKYIVLEVLMKLGRRMHEQSENFSDEISSVSVMEHGRNTKKSPSGRIQLLNQEIHGRVRHTGDAEKKIIELKDSAVELTQSEQPKIKIA